MFDESPFGMMLFILALAFVYAGLVYSVLPTKKKHNEQGM